LILAKQQQLLLTTERFSYCLLRQMHVALVYNLKRENADEVAGDRGERMQDDGDAVVAAPSVQREATKADTYAEWDTQETIDAVRAALEQRHRVSLIEANEEAFQRFRELQPDFVFNIAEGWRGASREAQIPAMLEMLGIPYTGSDPITMGVCLDKSRAKEILSYHKIPTPEFAVISSINDLRNRSFTFPSIVKPLHEGSSKGIFNTSVVRDSSTLQAEIVKILVEYEQPALVERFLSGREFTVALLGNPPWLRTLPIVEIRFDSLPEGVNPIYSYEAKWIWDQLDHPIDVHECPARMNPGLQQRIESICKQAFTVLGCRDWCRIDLRLDEHGNPYILELNPLPGILPNPEEHSCFPDAARAAGIGYGEMINAVLDAAMKRYGIE
jgi:D-alanine-D-alanine ligase